MTCWNRHFLITTLLQSLNLCNSSAIPVRTTYKKKYLKDPSATDTCSLSIGIQLPKSSSQFTAVIKVTALTLQLFAVWLWELTYLQSKVKLILHLEALCRWNQVIWEQKINFTSRSSLPGLELSTGESNNTNYTAVCSQSVGIDDLWKSRGLHSVRAFGHGPVYIGPCLRV